MQGSRENLKKLQGGKTMLRLTVSAEEYLMIGDQIKIVFLGGTANHTRIMIEAPKDINIARSKAIEKRIVDPEEKEKLPKYYREVEHPERYVKKAVQKTDKRKNK